MPSKKSKAKAPSAAAEGFTPERFERELKELAAKAQSDTWQRHLLGQLSVYARTIVLLGLLAAYSTASQLALSPVYGSIPASIWHSKLLIAACFTGWSGNLILRQALPMQTAQLLPLFAAYVPTVQFFLYRFSDALGAHWGPVVTETLTLFPLAVLSASCVADLLEDAQLTALPKFVADAAPGIGSWAFFKFSEGLIGGHLHSYIGKTFVHTRVGLEVLLAASYAVFAPSKYLAFTIPALLHTAVLNTHVLTPMSTASLNSTLLSDGWMLLDRKESLTGYVSVLESLEQGFRVLRCDHSLLGGEWVQFRGEKVAEPIYGVFVMLEAVRLVDTETPVSDEKAKALIIGLGIGTTPSAFVSHGIDTTVVEIDPVVHEFAVEYFGLQENNPAVLADAVSYTAELVDESPQSYDYIVHDVFTGGAEPVDLFTLEFLQGLAALLKPDGVIAINYAGDFNLPAPQTIVRTIKEVFPTCRIFREIPVDEVATKQDGTDFTNMVIFCKKTSTPLTFRRAVEQDFLRSHARRAFLEPRHEIQQAELLSGDDYGILRSNGTAKLTDWHKVSAAGHWAVMRTVLPAKVWERW